MRIEDELRQHVFESEQTKAHLNVLFTASFLHNRMTARLRKFGIYHEQYNVLRILRGQYPDAICQRDILMRMIDRSSNLTRIIARLKEKNYVTVKRSAQDRREYEISITQDGLDLLQRIDEENRDPATPPLNRLSDEDAALLNELLNKMRE
jgi:DNA-binding MarR family transcriptional regulator